MPISILFLSSAEISQKLLEVFYENKNFEIIALICQPDKKMGRGQNILPSEAKCFAENKGIPVFQPSSLKKDFDLLTKFQSSPPDFLITFAYGQILPASWLDIAKVEALNIHTSLLPAYRGASPIQEALLHGDKITGISLIRMVKKMDAGPIFSKHEIYIEENETAGTLHNKLSELAASNIPEDIVAIKNNCLKTQEQNHEKATYSKKIHRDQAFINFNEEADLIFCKWQAYTPWPALWTIWKNKRLKILECVKSNHTIKAGIVEEIDGKLLLGTAKESLELISLQLEGKRAMSAKDFLNGNKDFLGVQLPAKQ